MKRGGSTGAAPAVSGNKRKCVSCRSVLAAILDLVREELDLRLAA
jgi:hypothetical protein